jgi:phosphohistidine swiveling domain-containing protein
MSPDEAAFEAALWGGYGRILLVASLQGALDDSVARFGAVAKDRGSSIEILGAASPAALEATKSGSNDALLTALTATIEPFVGRIDAVLLAQYSLAPVALDLSDRIGLPVISGPQSAAAKLRDTLRESS